MFLLSIILNILLIMNLRQSPDTKPSTCNHTLMNNSRYTKHIQRYILTHTLLHRRSSFLHIPNILHNIQSRSPHKHHRIRFHSLSIRWGTHSRSQSTPWGTRFRTRNTPWGTRFRTRNTP